jgi:hypothetical protein
VKETHDYIHYYRGYWSEGGGCRIRIYQEDGQVPVVICSELPDNPNTSVTNMAEYLAAEVIREYRLPTPLTWVEHYSEHEGEIGEYSLVRFSYWELQGVRLGGVWRYRVGLPQWSPLSPEELDSTRLARRGASPHSRRTLQKSHTAWLLRGPRCIDTQNAGHALPFNSSSQTYHKRTDSFRRA